MERHIRYQMTIVSDQPVWMEQAWSREHTPVWGHKACVWNVLCSQALAGSHERSRRKHFRDVVADSGLGFREGGISP